jgi:hypothetical protein
MSGQEELPSDKHEGHVAPRNPYFDPSGVGAAAIASAHKHQGMPVFDWIDGLLFFAGLLMMVLVGVAASALVPALADTVGNWSRAFATVFMFGPILVRRAKFPQTRAWAGVPREGLPYRLMSILGLLLMPFAAFCTLLVVGPLLTRIQSPRPPLEGFDDASRQRFVEARMAEGPGEPTLLEAMGYAQNEVARTGTNDVSPEGLARRQAWIAEQRRASAESMWENERAHRQTLAESQVRFLKQERTIGTVGILALLLGILLMRARYDRSAMTPSGG